MHGLSGEGAALMQQLPEIGDLRAILDSSAQFNRCEVQVVKRSEKEQILMEEEAQKLASLRAHEVRLPFMQRGICVTLCR